VNTVAEFAIRFVIGPLTVAAIIGIIPAWWLWDVFHG
jgi:hypothetical protein